MGAHRRGARRGRARRFKVEDTRLEQLAAQGQRLEKEQQRNQDERQALSFAEVEQRLETLVAQRGAACRGLRQRGSRARDRLDADPAAARAGEAHLDAPRPVAREPADGSRPADVARGAAGSRARQVHGASESLARSADARRAAPLGARARRRERAGNEPSRRCSVRTCRPSASRASTRVAGSLAELTEGGVTLVETDGGAATPSARGDALLTHMQAPAAVASLLVGVRVAASIQEAIARRNELADGESFVTREGVWVGRRWLRMNRSDDPQVGVIARGDEIKRLRESTQTAARRVDEVAKALADTRFQLERLEEARAQAQAEATRRQDLFADTKAKLGASRAELEQARQRAAALDRAIADLATEQQSARHGRRREQGAPCELPSPPERARRDARRASSSSGASTRSAWPLRAPAPSSTAKRRKPSRSRSNRGAAPGNPRARRCCESRASSRHLTKRQQELNAEIQAAAEPLRADEQTLVAQARRAPARRSRSRQGAPGDGRDRRAAARDRAATQRAPAAPSTRSASSPTTCGLRFANRRFAPRLSASSSPRRASCSTRSRSALPADATAAVWTETFESARAEDSAARRDQPRGDRRVPGAIRAQEVPRRSVHGPHRGARDARERDPQDRS